MSRNGRKHRGPDEKARDRVEVARLYCQGWTQARIGERLGLSHQQVSVDLAAVRQEWLASRVQDFDTRTVEELAKIDRIEAVAWEAWERSCQDAEVFHAEKVKGRTNKRGDPLPDLEKAAKTTKGQAGDPRFLERVGWCVERRCKILGLDAPEKHDHSGTLTIDERRDRLSGIVSALRQRAGAGGDRGPANGPSAN